MPLFNTVLFTQHIENAYTQMVERYDADLLPDHIYVESSGTTLALQSQIKLNEAIAFFQKGQLAQSQNHL